MPQFELAWLFRIAENVCRDGDKSAFRRMLAEMPERQRPLPPLPERPPLEPPGLPPSP